MAEATLTASATARAPKARSPYRGLMAMLLAMMVLAGLGAAYTMLVSRQAEADAEEQGRRTPVEPSKRPRPLDRR